MLFLAFVSSLLNFSGLGVSPALRYAGALHRKVVCWVVSIFGMACRHDPAAAGFAPRHYRYNNGDPLPLTVSGGR